MLGEFIQTHRAAIVEQTRARAGSRTTPRPTDGDMSNGVPAFLDQLGDALGMAKTSKEVTHDEINESATRHGRDLLQKGLTVGQVVHDYGDVCQVISELALQMNAPISGDEFKTLNLCLDDAIAGAVTEFSRERERAIEEEGTERLGVLAHEMRNSLNTAMLSFEILKSGRVGMEGSTALLLGRSLMGLRDLIDRSLADVLLESGSVHSERLSVAEFIADIEIGASMQAKSHGIQFIVASVDRNVTIEGDRPILAAAVSNLLQNAFKFTHQGSTVSLTARLTTERVLIEVEDECGGLPPGKAEELFLRYEQRGADRSGVGLGLSICLKAARANGGELRVRDLPGKGCIFTLDLPRKAPLGPTILDGGKGKSATAAADGPLVVPPKTQPH